MEFYDAEGRSVEDDELWVTYTQLANMRRYPFTYWSLQAIFVSEAGEGLRAITRKVGRNRVVRLDEFEKWMQSHETMRKPVGRPAKTKG